MSKHTPGPWNFQGNGYGWRNGEYQSDGNAANGYCPFCAHGESASECVANARLIAAAPELLEACEAAVTMFSVKPDSSLPDDIKAQWGEMFKRDPACRRLLTAIAKAKGQPE
jgi:hypothetical protein